MEPGKRRRKRFRSLDYECRRSACDQSGDSLTMKLKTCFARTTKSFYYRRVSVGHLGTMLVLTIVFILGKVSLFYEIFFNSIYKKIYACGFKIIKLPAIYNPTNNCSEIRNPIRNFGRVSSSD